MEYSPRKSTLLHQVNLGCDEKGNADNSKPANQSTKSVSSSVPKNADRTSEYELVTYREIPYVPFRCWNEFRCQLPARNIVVSSERLRALGNPAILVDSDDDGRVSPDENRILHENGRILKVDNDSDIVVSSERPLNEGSRAATINFRSDSRISSDYKSDTESLKDDSDNDSDFWPYSCSDSDSWSETEKAREEEYLASIQEAGTLAIDTDSTSESSEIAEEHYKSDETESEDSNIETSSTSSVMSDQRNNSENNQVSFMNSKQKQTENQTNAQSSGQPSPSPSKRRRVEASDDVSDENEVNSDV